MHCRDFTRQSVAAFVKVIQRPNFRSLVLVLLAASLPRVSKFSFYAHSFVVKCGILFSSYRSICFGNDSGSTAGDSTALTAPFGLVSEKENGKNINR